MIYMIEYPGWEEPGIKGAYQEKTFRKDRRTMGSLEDAQGQHWYPLWYARGKNHREENGMIVCDVKEPVTCWFVQIEDMMELLELAGELGEIKIRPPSKEYFGSFPIIDLFE